MFIIHLSFSSELFSFNTKYIIIYNFMIFPFCLFVYVCVSCVYFLVSDKSFFSRNCICYKIFCNISCWFLNILLFCFLSFIHIFYSLIFLFLFFNQFINSQSLHLALSFYNVQVKDQFST